MLILCIIKTKSTQAILSELAISEKLKVIWISGLKTKQHSPNNYQSKSLINVKRIFFCIGSRVFFNHFYKSNGDSKPYKGELVGFENQTRNLIVNLEELSVKWKTKEWMSP